MYFCFGLSQCVDCCRFSVSSATPSLDSVSNMIFMYTFVSFTCHIKIMTVFSVASMDCLATSVLPPGSLCASPTVHKSWDNSAAVWVFNITNSTAGMMQYNTDYGRDHKCNMAELCASVDAEGKVRVKLVSWNGNGQLLSTVRLEEYCGHSWSEYLFFSYLIWWKSTFEILLCYNVMGINETIKIKMLLCNIKWRLGFFAAL